MMLDEAARKALQEYVSGKAHHPNLTPVTRRMLEVLVYADQHREELEALRKAEEGDATKLAELIDAKGELRTTDARAYAAARIRGDWKINGYKKSEANMLRRIQLWLRVTDMLQEEGMTQSAALNLCLEGYASSSFETIRSDFKRGGNELSGVLESLGFKPRAALRKE